MKNLINQDHDKKSFRATFTVVWLCIYTVMFFWQMFKGAYTKEVMKSAGYFFVDDLQIFV